MKMNLSYHIKVDLQMITITETEYKKTHKDFKGKFKNLQNLPDMEHLVGRRTFVKCVNGVTTLLIEGVSLKIVKDK